MITVIDSGLGVRLLYNDVEVFNHTDIAPFVKSLKGEVSYSAKNGNLVEKYDLDGEFLLSYRVLSASIKSANLLFTGYDGSTLKINVVEEKTKLKMYFTADGFSGMQFQFLTNPFEKVFMDGVDVKGKRGNNLLPAKISAATLAKGKIIALLKRDNPVTEIAKHKNLRFISGKCLDYDFETNRFASYDFSPKNLLVLRFSECPAAVTVTKAEIEDKDIIK